jgi:YHS domain-containing protein
VIKTCIALMLSLAAAPTFAQSGEGSGRSSPTEAAAINTVCPVGKEPIDGRSFTRYNDHRIGLCCPGCETTFVSWDSGRKDAFVSAAVANVPPTAQPATAQPADPGQRDAAAAEAESQMLASLYPLSVCPVTGKALGSMGAPVVKKYDGREVRFCCAGCVPKFDSDLQASLSKLDKQIAASQLPLYPLQTCVVASGKLGSMGEPDNFVYRNRLVRFCCAGCRGNFQNDPARYLKLLDDAAATQQRASYPLKACPVSGQQLGSMGDPVEKVLAGRLVRLCCPPCERQLREEPARFIAQIDEAWRTATPTGTRSPEGGR